MHATIIHNKIEAMNVQELKEVYKEGFGGTKGNGEIMQLYRNFKSKRSN